MVVVGAGKARRKREREREIIGCADHIMPVSEPDPPEEPAG